MLALTSARKSKDLFLVMSADEAFKNTKPSSTITFIIILCSGFEKFPINENFLNMVFPN